MKVKFALHFEERLLVLFCGEIQPLVATCQNGNAVRLIQMPKKDVETHTPAIRLVFSVDYLGGGWGVGM